MLGQKQVSAFLHHHHAERQKKSGISEETLTYLHNPETFYSLSEFKKKTSMDQLAACHAFWFGLSAFPQRKQALLVEDYILAQELSCLLCLHVV